jgi:hypothetical protein
MVPILIGEPVACTPGLEPQEERPAEALLLPPLVLDPPLEVAVPVLADVAEPVLADVDALPVEPPLLLLLDLLLPQPASANRLSAASSARQALILGTVK